MSFCVIKSLYCFNHALLILIAVRLKASEKCYFKNFNGCKTDDKIGKKMNEKLEAIKEFSKEEKLNEFITK